MPATAGFMNIGEYPAAVLYRDQGSVCVALTYRQRWRDGFGARGWKLDVSIGDPAIIASTRETGDRIPTSVLVHDVLDHLLSGFAVSGHRAEAMALAQLAKRTGSDISGDYRQLVIEDQCFGRVNGESWQRFFPQDLVAKVPAARRADAALAARWLAGSLGRDALISRLVARYFELGLQGENHAVRCWQRFGLQPSRSPQIGLALQQLLVGADEEMEVLGAQCAQGLLRINNDCCSLELSASRPAGLEKSYSAPVC